MELLLEYTFAQFCLYMYETPAVLSFFPFDRDMEMDDFPLDSIACRKTMQTQWQLTPPQFREQDGDRAAGSPVGSAPPPEGASGSQPQRALQACDPERPDLLLFQHKPAILISVKFPDLWICPASSKFKKKKKPTNNKIPKSIGSNHCFLNNTSARQMWLMGCEFATSALRLWFISLSPWHKG